MEMPQKKTVLELSKMIDCHGLIIESAGGVTLDIFMHSLLENYKIYRIP